MPIRMSQARPAFIPYRRPPAGAPNIALIVLDDVGFAQVGCFGSPVATPHIDRLAAEGLRFNRFHVTSICSATRAALLTGRNHHAVGVGMTMETPLGFPGYTGRIPASAALLPRILRDSGYNTFAVGKWHLTPRGEYSAAGPTDRWPLGRHMGFERFYGFLGAETSQWAPELWRDNTPVDAPASPTEGYHLSDDLAAQAVAMIRDQHHAAPDKPWLMYLALGAAHAPHQVAPEWSDPYRGRFDGGWESLRREVFERQLAEGIIPEGTRLSGRPSWIPDWTSLDADRRRLYARYMEVFAGFLSHADDCIGRVVSFLERTGMLDDTIVVVLSDNGASAEGTAEGTLNESSAWLGRGGEVDDALARIDEIGGHRAFNHYPWGWAWAGNTPLQLWKRYSWLGGVRTPMVVRWPRGVTGPGRVAGQFCHAVDVTPTLLDLVGIDPPSTVDGVVQQKVDGASLAGALADPGASSPRSTQYFEMHGSRAVYHEGWKATTDYVSPLFGERSHIEGSQDFDTDRWGLFDLDRDFAEAVDLAEQYPQRVADLERLWWAEAGANQVLPLFEGPSSLVALHPGEYPAPAAGDYEPGGAPVYEGVLPSFFAGATVTAHIAGGGDGVLCALGDLNDGFALYVLEGRPVATVVSGGTTTRVAGPDPLPSGRSRVSLALGGGRIAISLDGVPVASAAHAGLPMFPAVGTAAGGLSVGRDRGLAVNDDDYTPPFAFSGTLEKVSVVSGRPQAAPPASDEIARAQAAD
jgi:arylsulfatase A-like enzyme